MAILSVPSSRGRALSVSATINQMRVFPQLLATTDNAETRDLGFKTHGTPAVGIRGFTVMRDAPNHKPTVARLSVSLAARGRVTMCTLSMVADSAGARPRKMVTARMAKFDRFLLFSASPERQ